MKYLTAGFCQSYPSEDVWGRINDWLSDQQDSIEVIDLGQTHDQKTGLLTITILYKKFELAQQP